MISRLDISLILTIWQYADWLPTSIWIDEYVSSLCNSEQCCYCLEKRFICFSIRWTSKAVMSLNYLKLYYTDSKYSSKRKMSNISLLRSRNVLKIKLITSKEVEINANSMANTDESHIQSSNYPSKPLSSQPRRIQTGPQASPISEH